MMTAEKGDRDALTGLLTREAFERAVDEAIAAAEREGTSFSIALVDVDMFAELNDRHGQDAGDEVLRAVARSLAQEFGEEGTFRCGFRCGGDEMAIVLAGVEKEEALVRLERLREFLSVQPVRAGDGKNPFSFTVSVGISSYPDDGATREEVVRKATEALYRAKATGRNRTCLAREEKMMTKTSHYTQGQLARLRQLSAREGVGDAVLLREAVEDLFAKYDKKA